MKTFRAFGPTIGKSKLSKKIINTLNAYVDKSNISKKNDYSSKLASQIKNEIKIPKLIIDKNLSKELIKNIKIYLEKSDIKKIKEIKIINLWVVKQFKNEYNPIHSHSGHISGVGYLKVPKTMGKTTQKDKKINNNGKLVLIDGSKKLFCYPTLTIKPCIGDMYLFPSYLMHAVYPFSDTEEERRSISFNAKIDDQASSI